jgi:DNA-binding NarL/FixJ family response regulator
MSGQDGPEDTIAGPGARAVRIGIVDDHEVYRMGLRRLLERHAGVEVVWDTGSPHEAWDRAAEATVDAVLVDVHLGGPVDGLEVSRMLTARHPSLRVVLMSGLVDEERLAAAVRAGAAGFLPKELPADEMIASLVRLAGVTPAAPPRREARRLVFQDEYALEALSVRELEVLAEIRLGRTNREIAEKLRVSTSTVNKHVHRVLRKLRVRNRAEAAIVAAELLARPRHS